MNWFGAGLMQELVGSWLSCKVGNKVRGVTKDEKLRLGDGWKN